ncbi:hypothetical protein YDYSY3_01920 [Paenibacillus chitinolyticus]|nr:hypothetical protein YDYSY3_01920 [Paenibacillus chitinolyticus]
MHETGGREQGKLPADYRPDGVKRNFPDQAEKNAVIIGNCLYNKRKPHPREGGPFLKDEM